MKAILETNYRPVIHECYRTDEEFLVKWHTLARGTGAEGCAEQSAGDLDQADASFEFFKVVDGDECVGFFGTEKAPVAFLTTIFVKPSHRNKVDLSAVWDLIRKRFDGDFQAAIFGDNAPCIRFYSRHGEIVNTFRYKGHDVVLFHFKNQGIK